MTQVRLKFTGDVWFRMRTSQMDFAFEGNTLGALLDALFAAHAVRDLILDGDKIRYRSRIAVNGRFSDTLAGMQTHLSDGDVVILMRPGLGAT